MQKLSEIPFSSFFYATLVAQLAYAIPAVGVIRLFDLMEVAPLLWVVVPIVLVSVPVTAAMTWLIAKGSNWTNTSAALMVACLFPARFYGVVLGGVIGARFYDTVGGMMGMLLGYGATWAASKPLGRFITRKVLPATRPTQS